MDNLNHLLEDKIREWRETVPQLRNREDLTNRIMYGIHNYTSTQRLHQTWVRLVLNVAAIGLIVFFLLQRGVHGSSITSTDQNVTLHSVQESQAGKLIRQTTKNEALPIYLGFLQQRSRENNHFRSIRPTSKSLAL